jgi:hypothetical protein
MNANKIILFAACVAIIQPCITAQDVPDPAAPVQGGRQLTAEVSVVAFDTNGRFLGSPDVGIFESADDHMNMATKFHAGIAKGVPYGLYRIEARLVAYSSDVKYVRVYQQHVTIVLGLTVGHELPEIPPSLRGRVVGKLPFDRSFVRLLGVYSNVSMDSSIDPEGRFDVGGLSDGKYLLLVVGEGGVLANRTISIPYTGPPLEVKVGREISAAPR